MTALVSVVTLGGTRKRARLYTRTVCRTSGGVRGSERRTATERSLAEGKERRAR